MKTCRAALSLILSMLFVFGTAAGITIASYAADDAQAVTVKVTNSEPEVTIDYKESKQFDFDAENMPLDAAVHIFLNGEDQGEREYIIVKDPTEDYTVEAKVLGADGAVLASSGEIQVTVRNGFLDRVKSSLKKGFMTFGDAVMDILSAIFMTIWVFLNGNSFW